VPATDLGYLLHKHPGRVQSFTESVGTAHVFYPENTEARCTAALLLEVDPPRLDALARTVFGHAAPRTVSRWTRACKRALLITWRWRGPNRYRA
jgi:RNA repair, ligase-Pnkp-associating, region of Hen1